MKRALLTCCLLALGAAACSDDQPLAPAQVTVAVPAVTISGHGMGQVGALEFADGIGTCEISGVTRRAVIHQVSQWPGLDLTVFHVVAPAADNLHVLYIYSAGDTLRTVWHESYRDGLTYTAASGSVDDTGMTIDVQPALDALSAVPAAADLVRGLEISGAGIDYRDSVGSIVIDGKTHALYPFEIVDCSTCGEGDESGWLEVHAVTSGRGNNLGFAILYLFANAPGEIDLNYHVRFDPFRRAANARYEATWTLDSEAHVVTQTCAGATRCRRQS
jgi:hypothetical protein